MITMKNIREELYALVDSKYKDFHSALVPGAENILGAFRNCGYWQRKSQKEKTGVRSWKQPIPDNASGITNIRRLILPRCLLCTHGYGLDDIHLLRQISRKDNGIFETKQTG